MNDPDQLPTSFTSPICSTAPEGSGALGARYRVATFVLLLLGAAAYLAIKGYSTETDPRIPARTGEFRAIAWAALATALLLGLGGADIPVCRSSLTLRILYAIRTPSPLRRFLIATLLAISSAVFLWDNARRQNVPLDLRVHDENMYLVQARMLARGHLWMPQHPHAEFFESFHVFVRPVYAPMYFPGTALYYAPAVKLGIPTWIFSVALCGIAVGLTYLVITQLLDGIYGLLGAIMLLAISQFRAWGIAVMSHPLQLVLGLAMFLCALRWARTRKLRWAALLGCFAGWGLITRPLDGLCYLTPVGLLMLWELRTDRWPRRITTILIATLAAAPFLAIQGIQNFGVTGNLLVTPVSRYMDTYWPEMHAGWRKGGPAPQYKELPTRWLPQFQAFYCDFLLPAVREYKATPLRTILRDRLNTALKNSLPSRLLLILIPAGMIGLADRRRWALWTTAPLFLAAYLFFPFFLFHYVLVIAPVLIFAVLLAMRYIARTAGRGSRAVETFLFIWVTILTIEAFPPFSGGKIDQFHQMPALRRVNQALAGLPSNERALVFFTYHPEDKDSWQEEPVYNLDAAWPDDARIIRAHDLGERNTDLIDYYAKIQPDRRCYRYDLRTGSIRPMLRQR